MENKDEFESKHPIEEKGKTLSIDENEAHHKRGMIIQACSDGNIDVLIELADSPGGLLDDELRRIACEFR